MPDETAVVANPKEEKPGSGKDRSRRKARSGSIEGPKRDRSKSRRERRTSKNRRSKSGERKKGSSRRRQASSERVSDDQDSVGSTSTSSSDPEQPPTRAQSSAKDGPSKKSATQPSRMKSAPVAPTVDPPATKATSKSRKLKFVPNSKADESVIPDTPLGRRSSISIRAMREQFKEQFPDDPVPSHGILRQLYVKPDPTQMMVQRYKKDFPGEPIPSVEVLKKLYPEKPEILKARDLLTRQDSFMTFATTETKDWDASAGKPKKGPSNQKHGMGTVAEEEGEGAAAVTKSSSKGGKAKTRRSFDNGTIIKGKGKSMDEWAKTYHSGSPVPKSKNPVSLAGLKEEADLDVSMGSFGEDYLEGSQESLEGSNVNRKKGSSRKKKQLGSSSSKIKRKVGGSSRKKKLVEAPVRGRRPTPIEDDSSDESSDENLSMDSSLDGKEPNKPMGSWWNLSARDVSPEHRYSKALEVDPSPSPGRLQPDRAKWRKNSRTRSAPQMPLTSIEAKKQPEGLGRRERSNRSSGTRSQRRRKPGRLPSQPNMGSRQTSTGSRNGSESSIMKKEDSLSSSQEFMITGSFDPKKKIRGRIPPSGTNNASFEFHNSNRKKNMFLDSNHSNSQQSWSASMGSFEGDLNDFADFSSSSDNKISRFSNSFDNMDLMKGIDFNKSSTLAKTHSSNPNLGDFFGSNHTPRPANRFADASSVGTGVRSAGTLQPSSRDRDRRIRKARVKTRSKSLERARQKTNEKKEEKPKYSNSYSSGKKGWISEIPGMLKYAEPQDESDSSSGSDSGD